MSLQTMSMNECEPCRIKSPCEQEHATVLMSLADDDLLRNHGYPCEPCRRLCTNARDRSLEQLILMSPIPIQTAARVCAGRRHASTCPVDT